MHWSEVQSIINYIMNMETFLSGFEPNKRGRLCEPNACFSFSSEFVLG